jgi:triacylglycerol lipase
MNRTHWRTLIVAGLAIQLAACASAPTIDFTDARESAPASRAECVVLLHGLAKSSRSMRKVEKSLLAAGYSTANIDYPSRRATVDLLANEAIPLGVAECRAQSADRIHFVTHSMGAILVRQYLAGNDIRELGRVVMLSPPNQGTVVVDRFEGFPGFAGIVGPAGAQLGTDVDSVPRQLGPVDFEVGVIAGDKSINLIFSKMIPGEDDSMVAIESTKLEGMSDFLILHETHLGITRSEQAMGQILRFLASGMFVKLAAPQSSETNL